jgi:hypothetical protein
LCHKLDEGKLLDGSKLPTKFKVIETDIEIGIAGVNGGFGLVKICCMFFERTLGSVGSAFFVMNQNHLRYMMQVDRNIDLF